MNHQRIFLLQEEKFVKNNELVYKIDFKNEDC